MPEEPKRKSLLWITLIVDLILGALHITNGSLILMERTTLFPDVEARFAEFGLADFLGYILLIFGIIIIVGVILTLMKPIPGYYLLIVTSLLVLMANLLSLSAYRIVFGIAVVLIHFASLPATGAKVCDTSPLVCLDQ